MSNCFPDVLPRIKEIVSHKISSEEFDRRVEFHQHDILNLEGLDNIFKLYKEKGEPIEGIMHFAALKAIG